MVPASLFSILYLLSSILYPLVFFRGEMIYIKFEARLEAMSVARGQRGQRLHDFGDSAVGGVTEWAAAMRRPTRAEDHR